MEIFITLLPYILTVVAGFCEVVMDTLQFHYHNSVFKSESKFWNPEESWKNKYKDDLKTPKFIGSTTLFVFTTDGWHLFKFFRNIFMFLGISLLGYYSAFTIELVINLIIGRILYGLTFTFFYSYLLKQK